MILCGVRLEVLLLVTMKNTVLWNVTPCNLVGTSHQFWWTMLHIPLKCLQVPVTLHGITSLKTVFFINYVHLLYRSVSPISSSILYSCPLFNSRTLVQICIEKVM